MLFQFHVVRTTFRNQVNLEPFVAISNVPIFNCLERIFVHVNVYILFHFMSRMNCPLPFGSSKQSQRCTYISHSRVSELHRHHIPLIVIPLLPYFNFKYCLHTSILHMVIDRRLYEQQEDWSYEHQDYLETTALVEDT